MKNKGLGRGLDAIFESEGAKFGDDIKIKKNRSGGGKITIGFSSDEDIAYFLDKLEGR